MNNKYVEHNGIINIKENWKYENLREMHGTGKYYVDKGNSDPYKQTVHNLS